MEKKVYTFKLHKQNILFKMAEKIVQPITTSIMINQNQLVQILDHRFKAFLKSHELKSVLEMAKLKFPKFIEQEQDKLDPEIIWINTLILEFFIIAYRYRGLEDWLNIKTNKILWAYQIEEI